MTISKSKARIATEFMRSACVFEGFMNMEQFYEWFKKRGDASTFTVMKKPLSELKGWKVDNDTGNILHESGKFFSIEGIDVRTNFGAVGRWMQPIIVQPEIGILGFIVKKINGVLHFLVQAKMEPGNVNLLQISPTVQATRSNFTQVHGGSKPLYLEYFIERTKANVIIDQLQSEQGSRFFRKRNRNMIVEISPDETIDLHDEFCWLTLGQLMLLIEEDNIVNMDSRTVLSCVRYAYADINDPYISKGMASSSEYSKDIMLSSIAPEEVSLNDFDDIINWLTYIKIKYKIDVNTVPLNKVEGWVNKDGIVRHEDNKYFSIIGVSVKASTREVKQWEQPLIESAKGGMICFISKKIGGILHFLVQGKVEPGNYDGIEMAPSLQCTPVNYSEGKEFPPFYEFVMTAARSQYRYSALQSEEGGRFYHDQNKYMIIEDVRDDIRSIPDNYIWMTLKQIKEFIKFNNYFNIEARGLVACMRVCDGKQ